MAAIAQQMQVRTEMQLALLKKITENQQQMLKMLAAAEVGDNVDVTA